MVTTGKADGGFYDLRSRLVSEGTLFEDEEFGFKNVASSRTELWTRPPETIDFPTFTGHCQSPEGLKMRRGMISSDSFCIVADLLTRKPDLWKFVVADDQAFDGNYAGMFLFRFWRFGKVVPIVIDDMLPFNTVEGKCSKLTTIDGEECGLWCPLLEKAYAKFLGSYEQLSGVTVTEAMTDILGCSVHSYSLKAVKHSSLRILMNVLSRNGVAVAEMSDSTKLVAMGCEYESTSTIITSAKCKLSETGKIQCFLTLRNPLGADFCCYHEEEAEAFGELDFDVEEPGKVCAPTPCMAVDQFFTVFDVLLLGLCRFPGLFFSPEQSSTTGWETQVVIGPWRHSRSGEVTRYSSPMIRMKVEQPDAGGKLCTVMVSLMLCSDFIPEKKTLPPTKIGLTVLGLRGSENHSRRLPLKMLALAEPIFKSDMHHVREVCYHLSLQPGQYLLVPETDRQCCRSPTSDHKYRLTLFSLAPIILLNGCGRQKYGRDFLTPVELALTVPGIVLLGHPIPIHVKVLNIPTSTRLVMTILLTLNRCEGGKDRPIKTRLEHIQLTSGLLDKKLSMIVSFHEYARFPPQAEDLVARCSAFIHDTAVELKVQRTVTTILPTVRMTVNRTLIAEQKYLVRASLNNSLPFVARAAALTLDTTESTGMVVTPTELPPFSNIWASFTLTIADPGTHTLRTTFTSELFSRSVSADVRVLRRFRARFDYEDESEDEGASDSEREVPLPTQPVTCCSKHKLLTDAIDLVQVRTDLFPTEKALQEKLPKFDDSWSDDMMYCAPSKELFGEEYGEELMSSSEEEVE